MDDDAASPSPDVESQAKAMGWAPKEEWRGDPEKWITADVFVKRGEEFVPFLKASNRELQGKVSSTEAEVARLRGLYEASQEAIKELRDHQTEATKRAVAQARKTLKGELVAAKKDGDVEREVEISDQIAEIDAENRRILDAKPVQPTPVSPAGTGATDPIFAAWRDENAWFQTDTAKQGAALAIGNALRRDPAFANVTGRAFLDEVAKRTAAAFGTTKRPAPSKVEGGEGAPAGGGATANGGRAYSDLPPEARAVCERQSAKLVGEGRAFKTKADWQKHYVEQYFIGEVA